MTESVAVVGGGAVGVTAAYDLARRGADVTLYERDEVAAESTGRAAGLLYDAYAEDVDARIAERAIERFAAFSGEGDFVFERAPYVWFATEPGAAADAIARDADEMRAQGLDVERLTPAELAREYPALRTDDVAAAAVARNAGYTTPRTYADLLAAKAREAGAEIREETPAAVSLDPTRVNGTPYDSVLVAAGAHTKQVLADAGVRVPLKPYRVQALVASGPDVPLFWDATRDYYARPHARGVLAGDGTQRREFDPDTYDRTADDDFVRDARENLQYRLPDADVSVERAWAGLCVATPDKNPLLGELREDVFVAAGWQGHGFMRAPATGEAIAEQILGDRDAIAPFDPTRFTGDEEFRVRSGSDPD
ncbi:NAD(P)/FAD-dependent oxidoreductase [Salarchaeum japonicum]|uniref:FAD-binding oxidoreductase n=1 Tax=Salarchaeum japonicum TaxID=555573 RepID=A0AAV3T119_9EURY|nr:FAD-dependent oxidoreductase [Salarchaeum japonicum]